MKKIMTEAEPWIELKYDRNPLTNGMYLSRCEWHGDPRGVVRLDHREWDCVQHLNPWRLEVVSRDWFDNTVTVCRTDLPLPSYVYRRFEADVRSIFKTLRYQFGARLVLTAQVWGLAYVPMGAIPSTCHLFKRRK
ncbi:MAG: hypothetical protein KME45_03310 [Stenomitos rutilans HA7619-LM2]|jgi:hypothetical protein|nr:hypothetical protein [Stenomitos rutilans HA7619-LM2]MBW4469413.1 hypothetical protein [Stenomitos rutilans HA7619-LM2]